MFLSFLTPSTLLHFFFSFFSFLARVYNEQKFVCDVEAHHANMETVTQAEEGLFDTELSSIELCEEHLSSTTSSSSSTLLSSTPPAKDSSVVLPDWFERPGAPEAVEVRADLQDRYNWLKAKMEDMRDEGKALLGRVTNFENESGKFRSWLTGEQKTLEGLAPPGSSVEEIMKQLKEVEVRS